MSLLDDVMSGKILRIRDGNESKINGSIVGGELIAEVDADVRYGDSVRMEDEDQDYVVESVKRHKLPGGGSHLDNIHAKVVPRDEWEAKKQRETVSHVTQHIGSAGFVAGRDIHLTLNASAFLQQLETEIQNNPAIPPEEKKTWLSKIKEVASNPEVWASIVKVLWDLYPKSQ